MRTISWELQLLTPEWTHSLFIQETWEWQRQYIYVIQNFLQNCTS
jgi:hypothetical protein